MKKVEGDMAFYREIDNGQAVESAREGKLFDNRRLDLFSVEELANELGYSPKTIQNWVAKRSIPFIPMGGKTLFEKQAVMAWLKRKEFKPWL